MDTAHFFHSQLPDRSGADLHIFDYKFDIDNYRVRTRAAAVFANNGHKGVQGSKLPPMSANASGSY